MNALAYRWLGLACIAVTAVIGYTCLYWMAEGAIVGYGALCACWGQV